MISTTSPKGILQAIPLYPIAYTPRYPITPQSLHITLAFGISQDLIDHWIDAEFWAEIIEEAWNDRVQAFKIKLPDWVMCQNQHPHIALSYVPDAAPVEANDIWKRGHNSQQLVATFPFVVEFQSWGEI